VKTVSLAEALRSGKDFVLRFPDSNIETKYHKSDKSDGWTTEAILHAECQIIEEPREIWVWEYDDGAMSGFAYKTKDDCKTCTPSPYKLGRPVKFREVCDE